MTLAPAQLTKVLPHGCAYLFFALLLSIFQLLCLEFYFYPDRS